MMNKLLLLELNEINFEFIENYTKKYKLKNLNSLKTWNNFTTDCEKNYDQLEPWIQWVSVHTGKSLKNHKIFRLGDIHKYKGTQIFEKIKEMGFSVGAISPMNADLRMEKPDFFIPDPWTESQTDGSFWSKRIYGVIRQVVNDNAQGKITLKNKIFLLSALIKFAQKRNYIEYFQLALGVKKGKKWNKALFLDLFLFDIHTKLTKKNKTQFSTLFLNSFAHIQHHYFFNSEFYNGSSANPAEHIKANFDPLHDAAVFIDKRIGDLTKSFKNYDFIIATGLSQTPFKGEKYYYRLIDHSNFLNLLNIKFSNVLPRMTRDFEILFKNNIDRDKALRKLKALVLEKHRIFNEIEIRDKSLFVTLSYGNNVKNNDIINLENKFITFSEHIVPVAYKNGEHSAKGFTFLSKRIKYKKMTQPVKVWKLNDIIVNYFTAI